MSLRRLRVSNSKRTLSSPWPLEQARGIVI